MKEIEIEGHCFLLHPSGAVFWQETKTWLLADMHLGKVAHFRKNGVAVPRKAEGTFYQKMEVLLALFPPKRIFFLGDLFHSFQNNEWFLFKAWVEKQQTEMILVEGNHDVIPSWKFKSLGLTVAAQWEEGPFYFSHYPTEKENQFVFCGHVHPGVKLRGSGLQQLKLPCFFQTPQKMILPAFGSFTGLHILKPTPKDCVFVCTQKEVMAMDKKV